MEIGEDASAAGYPLVPNTGEEGRIRHGAREINRTRDMVARLGARFKIGVDDPTEGIDGDIYFKVV